MRWRWALPPAVLVFLLTFLLHAPAAVLYAWGAPAGSPVTLDAVSGTVREGDIGAIRYAGHVVVRELHWTLRPWHLLLGEVSAHVAGGGSTTPLSADLSAGLTGLHAGPLTLHTDLKTVLSQVGFPFLPLDGLADVQIQTLRSNFHALRALDGTVTLRSLRWRMGSQPLVLGDFSAVAKTANDGAINAEVRSLSGPLDVSGTAGLSPDGRYHLDLLIAPKPGAPPDLINLLRPMGRPDPQGRYHLQTQGRLGPPPR